MKNIINYDINFKNIPFSVKKYLYIHNDIYQDIQINKDYNKEELIEIKNEEIKCKPFWNDELVFTWNEEDDYIINLEGEEMSKYIKNNPNFWIFVRKEVKNKLLEIDKYLKEKWYYLALKIWYRPVEVQKSLFEEIFKYYKEKHITNPEKTEKEIYNETIQMISDPSKFISPHTTGGAVDVVLYDENWDLVDMWCVANYIWDEAHISTDLITDKQKANRDILIDSFLNHWFATLASEWWHFSYWDQAWAKFVGEKEARYWSV